jgi:hypothetical protein
MAEDAGRDDEIDHSRRAFIKKGLAAAFVAPVIVSFALDGVAEAREDRQRHPNQTFHNQHEPEDGRFHFR